MRARSQRGFALLAVLWVVALLAIIAIAMSAAMVATSRIDRTAWTLARTETIADAVVNRTVLALLDTRPGAQGRVDGVERDVTFDGVKTRVWVQDEAGKIDLNTADKTVLASLFARSGLGQSQADALADDIAKVRDGRAPAVAFRTVDELRSRPGVSARLFARIAPLATVYSHNAGVDQSVAPRAVLLVLPDMDAAKADLLLSQRNDAYAKGTPQAVDIGAGRAFMISAEVDLENVRFVRQAVVQMTGDKDKPFWFVSWQ